MTRRRAIGSSRHALTRDQDTIRLVNECILVGNIKELRRIAAARGLVNGPLRRKAWPLLLGLDPQSCRPLESEEYERLCAAHKAHRDSSVVSVDVARCLHDTNSYVGSHNRDALRQRLAQLLNAVVDGKNVYYYQGLHELAAVMMLEVGDTIAYHALQHLVVTHLRDNTRASLDATLQALHALGPLLRAVDPQLHAHLHALELPPYYALSWMLTWFAHDVKRMTAITRLFDLFLACHPLMPLYLGAVVMLQIRDQLLEADSMPEVHTQLVNVNILDVGLSIDDLAFRAAELMHNHPPLTLGPGPLHPGLRCATIEAKLVNGAWWVPESAPPLTSALLTNAAIDWFLRLPSTMRRGRAVMRVVTSTSAIVASAAIMLALARIQLFESHG